MFWKASFLMFCKYSIIIMKKNHCIKIQNQFYRFFFCGGFIKKIAKISFRGPAFFLFKTPYFSDILG